MTPHLPFSRLTCDALRLLCVTMLIASSAAAGETLVRDVAAFDAAVKAAKPGDSIVLADGEWRDADLVFQAEGTEKDVICLTTQTPGKVVLTGSSRLRISGKFLAVVGLYWKDSTAVDDVIAFRRDSKTLASSCLLSNCAIIGDAPTAKVDRKWVSLYGRENVVTNCRFEGKQSRGTLLVVWLGEGPSRHGIHYNFFGPRSVLGKNGGEQIRIGDSNTSLQKSETQVGYNYFYHCDGEAEIISNKSCNNDYNSNTFVGCGGALTLRHGNACVVGGNAFFGDGRKGTGGVRVIGENHIVVGNLFYELTGDDARAALSIMNGVPNSPLNQYFQVKRAVIADNRFVRCKQTILVGLSDDDRKNQTLPALDCKFEGNAVVTKDRPVFEIRTAQIGAKFQGNEFAGGELGLSEATGWSTGDAAAIERDANDLMTKITRPGDVGPDWMQPGDEYLPQALRPAK